MSQQLSPAAREAAEQAEILPIIEGNQFENKTVFGFWVYLMTDLILFASLFATFAILRNNTAGGPGGAEIFSLPYVLAETTLLLTSSFTAGLGMLAARRGGQRQLIVWFMITFVLGAAFLTLELREFSALAADGHSWARSGFLSGFFTLVGTHGAHIACGLIWMIVLLVRVAQKGITPLLVKRFALLSLFWHMLDVVWIFIFTIVYLLGVL
jgi:cytochrome o ubiquinol oxidase subunit 3